MANCPRQGEAVRGSREGNARHRSASGSGQDFPSHEKIHVAFRRLIWNRGYYDPVWVCPEYEIKVKNEVLRAFAPDEESQN